jgi:HEAT repeat protein/beta-lactamase regulating signal transducer with metallopeptidase domain
MSVATDFTLLLGRTDAFWLTVADAILKVTLLLSAAGAITMALGRASAAVRHLVWTLALVSALVLPALSLSLPRWQLPVITLDSQASPVSSVDSQPAPPLRTVARREPAAPITETAAAPAAPAPAVAASTTQPSLSWTTLLAAVWLIGMAAIVGRLLVGMLAVQWMSRRTETIADAPWLPLARALAAELGLTRRLTFLRSPRATMPMAWGMVRRAVLMPADADDWPIDRLRIVLLHELAHVRRRDCLTHAVAQLACAFHWFNPLAWIAARHIRTERERACDDLVLAAGTRSADYAEELLEIARVMRAGRFPALVAGATLAMAHRSQLEGRLIAILDPKIRRSTVTRVRTAVAAATVSCAVLPLAAVQPWVYAEPPVIESNQIDEAGPGSIAAAPQAQPQPRPNPTPNPNPDIATRPPEVATQAAADGAGQAQNAAQAAVQGAMQGVAQGAVQGVVQSVVQSARQGAIQGATQAAVQAATQDVLGGRTFSADQDAKRSAADPRMIAALTAALKDSDKDVRETAMHALIQLRDPSIFEPLVQALKDSSPDVRESAAQGLAQLRDRRAVDPLMAALKDENAGVREKAIFGLGQLRDPRSVDALTGALKDANADVREQAAFALSQIRDPKSVDALIAALQDQNADVRQQAAFALAQLRDRRASAALAAAVKDSDADVREQAVFALGQLRDPAAVDGLVAALKDLKPDVRQQAAFALGQIRDRKAVDALIAALKDDNADVRQQAAFALGQIRDRAAVEALVLAIKDSSADVREQVAFALGQLRDPRAIEALTAALKDPVADVRQQAAFALGQLAR